MKLKPVAVVAACVLLACTPAWAHRIDEYLQATILSLASNRASASMRLIPGVMVAPSVIATIDTDHDGAFSDAEKQAYAHRVLRDRAITIDGKQRRLNLIPWPFRTRRNCAMAWVRSIWSTTSIFRRRLPPNGP